MRAEEAKAIAEEKRRGSEKREKEEKIKKEQEAQRYAEESFRPSLDGIFKRIKEVVSAAPYKNEIDLGITVNAHQYPNESSIVLGERLLVEKLVNALRNLGYCVESYTEDIPCSCGECTHGIERIDRKWKIKW